MMLRSGSGSEAKKPSQPLILDFFCIHRHSIDEAVTAT